METLARWAAYLAMAGGVLFTVTLIILAFSPTSPTWYGLFVGTVLLGGAVAGLYWQAQNPPMTPVLAVEFAAFTAWLIGSLGFAVALIRTRTLSRLGAWLVLAGAFVAVATTPLYGVTVDPTLTAVITLLFGLMPVGWIVIGFAAWRQAGT